MVAWTAIDLVPSLTGFCSRPARNIESQVRQSETTAASVAAPYLRRPRRPAEKVKGTMLLYSTPAPR